MRVQNIQNQAASRSMVTEPVTTNEMNRGIGSIYADGNVLKITANPSDNAVRDKHYLSCVAFKISISVHTQTTGLVQTERAGLMTIKIPNDIAECRCSLTR